MTPEERLRELSAAATAAPWRVYQEVEHPQQVIAVPPSGPAFVVEDFDNEADAALIAYQRNLAEPLADVVAAARREIGDFGSLREAQQVRRDLRAALRRLDKAAQ